MFNRLCLLKEVAYLNDVAKANKKEKEKLEKYANLLSDYTLIETYIEKSFTSDTQLLLTRAMEIVKEHYKSRVYFDLDAMFDEQYSSDTQLKPILELQVTTTAKELQHTSTYVGSDFYTKLFRDGDVEGWKDALGEHNARIEGALLKDIIKEASKEKDDSFNRLPFIANPEWVGVVARYVEEKEYLVLLKASHDARFNTHKMLDFEIDSFQVTFAEYDKYLDIAVKDKPKSKDKGWGRGRRPVINVSWDDAKAYTTWLNEKLERTYALPTEKEWELACNLGKKSKWHFGKDESKLKEYAWYDVNSKGKTHPIGSLNPNDINLYDMHGNVWEWCEDWYDGKEKKHKSLRGGSWNGSTSGSRSAYRFGVIPSSSFNSVGFRLLRTLP